MSEDKKEAEATPAAAAAAAPAPAGNSKMVLILTGVNLLLTVGVGAVLVMSFSKQGTKPTIEDISTEDHGEEHAEASGGHGEAKGGHGEAKGGHGDAKGGDHAAADAKFGKIVPLEEFTVNLATTGSVSPKYARVNISIEVPSGDVEAEVNHKVPQIRNTIIDLFNAKRPTDLATGEGRTNLKEEIKSALNTFMVTGKIKGVFFTSFAVSS